MESPKWRPENIPFDLCLPAQWVGWTYGKIRRAGRPAKVPVQANGHNADVSDPTTWTTFEPAVELWRSGHAAGIGFVVTRDDEFVGIDLDKCRTPETGEIAEWAVAEIRRFNSYTEVSPSGTGIRIFVKGRLPPTGRRRGNVEMYDDGHFLTVTGLRVSDFGLPSTVERRQQELLDCHAIHIGNGAAVSGRGRAPHSMSGSAGTASLRPMVTSKLREHRRRNLKFDLKWERRERGPTQIDDTPSGWCTSVAISLCYVAWPDGEIVEALHLYREHHRDSQHHNDQWFWNVVSDARNWVDQHPVEEQAASVVSDSLLAAATRHLDCLKGNPEAFGLLIRMVRQSRDGGRTAKLPRNLAARFFGVSESTMQRRIATILSAGCASVRVRADGTHLAVYDLHVFELGHPHRGANLTPDA